MKGKKTGATKRKFITSLPKIKNQRAVLRRIDQNLKKDPVIRSRSRKHSGTENVGTPQYVVLLSVFSIARFKENNIHINIGQSVNV